MFLVYYLLLFALLTVHLSPAVAGVAVVAGGSCLECSLEDGGSRGKLSFNPIISADEGDYLKAIALANSPALVGVGGGVSPQQEQQQKTRYYYAPQQHQHLLQHQKILAQQQQRNPAPSAATPPAAAFNLLLHLYTLLKKGSAAEPKLTIDGYYLQDPLSSVRIAKKAERGMLVDVLDYVSKPDDRNRRVGQNMRSSG